MTMTKLEEIARAVWGRRYPGISWDGDVGPSLAEEVKLLSEARAAVETIRAPSQAMILAGCIAHEDPQDLTVVEIFQAICDAILTETPETPETPNTAPTP